MFILRYIATLFINFFSITQPNPESQNRAALYIAALLLGVGAFLAVIVTITVHVVHHSLH
jgi:hypothetical protein